MVGSIINCSDSQWMDGPKTDNYADHSSWVVPQDKIDLLLHGGRRPPLLIPHYVVHSRHQYNESSQELFKVVWTERVSN